MESELLHYGVLGMKWGVRRGRAANAYERASKKLNKLNKKVEKAENKARKRAYIADKRQYGFALPVMRDYARAKAKKTAAKASKKMYKAKKWIDAMDKTFKNTNVSLSKEQINLGKAYTEKLDTRASMRGLY